MKPIVARPTAATAWCCAFFLSMGVVGPIGMYWEGPGRPEALVFAWGSGALLAVPALVGLIACARIRWGVDEDGLRWRGLVGGWQSARWDEIAGFGIRKHIADARHDKAQVRLADGRTLTISRDHDGFVYLRDALSARVPSLPDADPEIVASSRNGLFGVRILSPVLVAAISWLLAQPIGLVGRARADGTLGWWTWGAAATGLLILLPVAAGVVWMAWSAWTERPQRITLTADGFTVGDGNAVWSARWDEIVSAEGRTVATPHGTVTLSPHLDRFRRVVAEFSAHTSRPSAPEALSVGGPWVFGYDSRERRAVLWLPLAMGLVCFASVFVRAWLYPDIAPVGAAPFVVGGELLALGLWALWRMHSAKVEVDVDAIVFVDLRGRTRVRWSDIDDYGVSGSDLFTWCWIDALGSRHRFWAGIVGGDALAAEIARRAPTPRTGWPRDARIS